jgi:hypothetical protein
VFVTPEYNHGISGALKTAIDSLYREWNNTAAGCVSDGGVGGARAVAQLWLVMGEIMVTDVRAQVMLSLFTDFEHFSTFTPDPRHEAAVHTILDQVIAWGGALQSLQSPSGDAMRLTGHLEVMMATPLAHRDVVRVDSPAVAAACPRPVGCVRSFRPATGPPLTLSSC